MRRAVIVSGFLTLSAVCTGCSDPSERDWGPNPTGRWVEGPRAYDVVRIGSGAQASKTENGVSVPILANRIITAD